MTASTVCGKCKTDNMYFTKSGRRFFWKCRDCGRIEGCHVPKNPYQGKTIKNKKTSSIKESKFWDEREI